MIPIEAIFLGYFYFTGSILVFICSFGKIVEELMTKE